MDIAFIGMGIMGRPMAVNLRRAGHAIFVHGRRPETMAGPVEAGCGSIAEATAQAEIVIVIVMVPDTPELDSAAVMKIVERECGMER